MKNWIQTNEVRVLSWPSNAADLNPIENIWAIWKGNMSFDGVRDKQQLWASAVNSWNALRQDQDIMNSLLDSMPRRLREVIQNDGNYTSY